MQFNIINNCHILAAANTTPGPLFQKVISENRIRGALREVVGSFYENVTAITERDGTLSEACRKCTSDCLQNIVQNDLRTP